MALIAKTEHYGKEIENAYYRIVVAIINATDDEVYDNLPNGDQIIRWESNHICHCVIHIYGNEGARRNCVAPLKQTDFRFKFDVNSSENILTQAYNYYKNEVLTEYKDA